MSDKLTLEIVTPYGAVATEEVEEVTAPGSEGEFGVLPGHAPFITTLRTGMLATRSGAEAKHYFVSWGYAEVGSDKVVILADSAERAEEIDIERAVEAKKRAEEMLRKQAEVDFTRAEASLERAVSRIHIAEKYGQK